MSTLPIKQGEELFSYIPQRPPFVMVDALYEKGEDYVLSGFTVAANNLLVEGGLFQEGGLVENIAQTAALLAGIRAVEACLPVPLGFIAGIRNLEIKQLPAIEESIRTHARLTHDLGNVQVVEGSVFNHDDELLARCELRIFIKEEE